LLNPYVGRLTDAGLDATGVVEIFRCPSDAGTLGGVWPSDRLPTHWDVIGASAVASQRVSSS